MASDIYTQSDFLMIKIACMYYLENIQQPQIAKELNISITTVSRFLKRAKEEKIIRYIIDDKYMHQIELAEKIRLKYNLEEVIIASNPVLEEGIATDSHIMRVEKRKKVALEAARYLQRIIQEKDVLGISWGRIVCDMLLYLNPSHKVDATFVTLHGKLGGCILEDVQSLVKKMAKAFSGRNYYLKADALAESQETAEKIRRQKDTQDVYEMFEKVNIAITGVGTWYPEKKSILAQYNILNENEQDILSKDRAVGDIGLRFFDAMGKECGENLNKRLLSMDFEQFKKIKRKITVAAGLEKAYTLDCALEGSLIDVLILDEELAEHLLNVNFMDVFKK